LILLLLSFTSSLASFAPADLLAACLAFFLAFWFYHNLHQLHFVLAQCFVVQLVVLPGLQLLLSIVLLAA